MINLTYTLYTSLLKNNYSDPSVRILHHDLDPLIGIIIIDYSKISWQIWIWYDK